MQMYNEKLHKKVLTLTRRQARKLIIWCARRHVPTDAANPALDAIEAATRYLAGEIDFKKMSFFHAAAIRFYTKMFIADFPWKGRFVQSDARNIAMLAKLCTVDDQYIRIAAQDAIYVLHALEPFDEAWLVIGRENERIEEDEIDS